MRSATGFMRVMAPAASVAITASPIDCSVITRFSSLSRSACSASLRAVMSRTTVSVPTMSPAALRKGLCDADVHRTPAGTSSAVSGRTTSSPRSARAVASRMAASTCGGCSGYASCIVLPSDLLRWRIPVIWAMAGFHSR